MVESKTGDVTRAAGIEQKEQVFVVRQADRSLAAGRNDVKQKQLVAAYPKDRDLVAACVYGEQPTPAIAQHQGSLRTQPGTGAQPSSSIFPGQGKRAVGCPVINQDRVARSSIGHHVDHARFNRRCGSKSLASEKLHN